jgi:hypothetical protein
VDKKTDRKRPENGNWKLEIKNQENLPFLILLIAD